MHIKRMIEREDFYRINEDTIKRYFEKVHGEKIQVETKNYSFFNKILIYPRLGVEMTRFPSRKIRKYMLQEYNIRNSVIKYLIAKTYVWACFLSCGVMGEKGLSISKKELFHNELVIIPANRKIRIYDFNTGFVDAIIKETFTKKYFENELSFRLNNKYDFVLPILDYGDDWYREKILPGQPLARVINDDLYSRSVEKSLEYVKQLAKDTLKYVNAGEYCEGLLQSIEKKLPEAKERGKINTYDTVLDIARCAYKAAVNIGREIPLVCSHGDLQNGNIWVNKEEEKVYIIDWETHDFRSAWYDCATLSMSTRRAGKMRELMFNRDADDVKEAVLKNDERKEYDMLSVVGIITLEDILFYLEDMLELPEDFGGDIFNRIVGELDQMQWRNHVVGAV